MAIEFRRNGAETVIRTKINVKFKILKITVFRFRHSSDEVWKNGAFSSFTGKTDNNGKPIRVVVRPAGKGLSYSKNDRTRETQGAMMSWIIWCEAALKNPRILDPTKGSVKDFAATYLDQTTLKLGSRELSARRYRVVRKGRVGELWYGPAGILVKVEFPTRLGTKGSAVLLDQRLASRN